MATPTESKSIISLHMLDDECFTAALGQLSMKSENPWNENMHAMLNKSSMISQDLALYIKSLKLQQNETKSQIEWEHLSTMILSHLLIIKIKVYEQNIDLNSATARLLEDILSIYGTVALKVAAIVYKDVTNNSRQLSSYSQHILSKLKHTFHWTELCIAHCLLKLKFDRELPACVAIMKKMYYDILFAHRITHFDDMTLCAYYLLFCKYKRISAAKNHIDMQQRLLARFHKKAAYLNNLPILSSIVDHKSSNGRLQIVSNYFKYIKDKEKSLEVEAANNESSSAIMNADKVCTKNIECYWEPQNGNDYECSNDERIITFVDSTNIDDVDEEENADCKHDEKTVYFLELTEEFIEQGADGKAAPEDITNQPNLIINDVQVQVQDELDLTQTEVTEAFEKDVGKYNSLLTKCNSNEDEAKSNIMDQLQEYQNIEKLVENPMNLNETVEKSFNNTEGNRDQTNYLFQYENETPPMDKSCEPHLTTTPQRDTDAICNVFQTQVQSLNLLVEEYGIEDVATSNVSKLHSEPCNETSTFHTFFPAIPSLDLSCAQNVELRRKAKRHKAITLNRIGGLQAYHYSGKLIDRLIMPSFMDETLLKSSQISSPKLQPTRYEKQLLSSLDMDIDRAFAQINCKPIAMNCNSRLQSDQADPKLFKLKPVVDLSQFRPLIYDFEIETIENFENTGTGDVLMPNHMNNYTDREINMLLEAVKLGTEMRLPFKKRRMTVPEEKTICTDISYPATTMVSIAELETVQPTHCGHSYLSESPSAVVPISAKLNYNLNDYPFHLVSSVSS